MENQFSNPANFFKKLSETVYLFKKIWKENSIALLNAPQDDDKTEQIIEIIDHVAVDGRKVVYVNTEHRADDFIERFVDNENLVIFTPAYDSDEEQPDYAELVFSGIEKAVTEYGVRTFIIDSISRIAAKSFGKNASPAFIMKRLAALQDRYHLSLLVIAHSSTKSVDRAIKILSDSIIPVAKDDQVVESNEKSRAPQTDHHSSQPVICDISDTSDTSYTFDTSDTSSSATPRKNRPSARFRRKFRAFADN